MIEFKILENLTESLKKHLLLDIEILKLEATNQISMIGSTVISSLFISVCLFLFMITLSIGLGFYLSALFGNWYSGFAIISIFYLIVTIILFVGRKKLIEKPMRDKIIKKMLENKES